MTENRNRPTRRTEPLAIGPLTTLLESQRGRPLPLPPRLARLYGSLRLSQPRNRPHVFSNFVTTLDGVVSLNARGHASGADISGHNAGDRMVMGLLRTVADAVVVGSGTLDIDRRHVWTAEAICPELAADFRRLRHAIGKTAAPLNVVVTGSGRIDLRLPEFTSGKVRVLIVTTALGEKRLRRQRVAEAIEIRAIRGKPATMVIPAQAILDAITASGGTGRILIEGGPQLLGDFYAAHLVAEQFLTLAPQIAGRDRGDGRLSLVMGRAFAPRHPLWGTLTDLRRGGSHLFLRYSFAT